MRDNKSLHPTNYYTLCLTQIFWWRVSSTVLLFCLILLVAVWKWICYRLMLKVISKKLINEQKRLFQYDTLPFGLVLI